MMSRKVTNPTPAYFDRMSPWSVRIWQMLEAKGKVPMTEAASEAGRLIPPGQAYRFTVYQHDWARRRRAELGASKSLGPKRPEDDEDFKSDAIRLGRVAIIRRTVAGMVKNGRIAVKEVGDRKVIERGPNYWPFPPPSGG